jgi:PAS domain S-box-containing protein
MGETDKGSLRAAALHLDRHRGHIEREVDERLGRTGPAPAARAEIVRRFRSFARLASLDWDAARPSFDGLGGNTAAALESTIGAAVDAAAGLTHASEIREALTVLSERFRAGIRRSFQARDDEPQKRRRSTKRRPNAGRRVRSAIDRISDSYIALCLDTGTIYDLNPAAENLLGSDPQELLGREIEEFVPADEMAGFRSLTARLDAGEDAPPMHMKLKRLTGESVPVEMTVANHTIGGRRLAIFSARERTELGQRTAPYSTRTTSAGGILASRESTARST